jgi:hypothetical protein
MGQKGYQSFWDGLGTTQRTALQDAVAIIWTKYTGLSADDMSEVRGVTMVDALFNILGGGDEKAGTNHANEVNNGTVKMDDLISKLDAAVKKQQTLGTSIPEAKQFKKDWKIFQDKFNLEFELGGYDKTYWTEDKLRAVFNEQYAQEGGHDYLDSIATDTLKTVSNDFAKRTDPEYEGTDVVGQQALDEKGVPITGDGTVVAGEPNKWEVQVKDLAKKYGFELSEGGYKHFGEMLKKKEADIYEIETLMKQTPEALTAEYNKNYAQYAPTVDKFAQDELDIINKYADKAPAQIAEGISKYAIPEIRKEVGDLGTLGMGDTYQADLIAKTAGELSKEYDSYFNNLRMNSELGKITNKANLEAGKFGDIKALSTAGAANNAQSVLAGLNTKLQSLADVNNLNASRSANVVSALTNRMQRDAEKELRRQQNEYMDRIRSANKKAAKFGLGASILSGMASGGIAGSVAGPWGSVIGAISGGVVGGVQGNINQRNVNAQNDALSQSQYGVSGYTPNQLSNINQPDWNTIFANYKKQG